MFPVLADASTRLLWTYAAQPSVRRDIGGYDAHLRVHRHPPSRRICSIRSHSSSLRREDRPEVRTAVVIMLEHRMHSRTQGVQLCPTRRVDVGGCELAVRAPQDFDPIHLVLAARGDDLAVPRMSLHPLELRIVDIPHRGGRPLA